MNRTAAAVTSLAAGLFTACLAAALLGSTWQSCPLAFDASLGVTVPFWGAAAGVVTVAVWGLAFAVLGGKSMPAAVVAALLGTLVLLFALLAWLYPPPGAPAGVCDAENTAPWWPQWLPL
ncbi:hypothetical protein AB0M28_01950 [Streptomyces sp. NPDC051940]|uniref:hypothetical protein n=1 Tax=Streptomyces sp. NPDC051940 TaxID=3155675 RepID=UPI0034427EAE